MLSYNNSLNLSIRLGVVNGCKPLNKITVSASFSGLCMTVCGAPSIHLTGMQCKFRKRT